MTPIQASLLLWTVSAAAAAATDGPANQTHTVAIDLYRDALADQGDISIPYLAIVDERGASCWQRVGAAATDLKPGELEAALLESKAPCSGPEDEKLVGFTAALGKKIELQPGRVTLLMLAGSPQLGVCPPCEELYPQATAAAAAAGLNWIRLQFDPPRNPVGTAPAEGEPSKAED